MHNVDHTYTWGTPQVPRFLTNYLYNGQKVVLETDGAGNVKARYLLGVNYLGRMDGSGKLSYFLYNGHGDVVQTIAENGTVENQTLAVEPQYNCAIRYAGYQYDKDTGDYYLNARHYNPLTARFLSEDTYRGQIEDPLSLNLYTYCQNEPVMNYDPTGYASIGSLIGV